MVRAGGVGIGRVWELVQLGKMHRKGRWMCRKVMSFLSELKKKELKKKSAKSFWRTLVSFITGVYIVLAIYAALFILYIYISPCPQIAYNLSHMHTHILGPIWIEANKLASMEHEKKLEYLQLSVWRPVSICPLLKFSARSLQLVGLPGPFQSSDLCAGNV